MIKRIVEVSNPTHLRLHHKQLILEREGESIDSIPIEDLGVLILDHPAITYTQGILTACCDYTVAVVLCNAKHLPGALLLPLEGHSLHSKIIHQQISISEPCRKRLWQTLVQAKIQEQANALQSLGKSPSPLTAYLSRVRSGDPDNIEALAAKVYWKKLFGKDFTRNFEEPGLNSLLNYGYAILRAAVARSIVASGLHPSIGIHHHNQYDSFCLVDDMIEPLRPLVDKTVFRLSQGIQAPDLNRDTKQTLLELLSETCSIGNQRLPLSVALHHYAASLRKVMSGEAKDIEIPEL